MVYLFPFFTKILRHLTLAMADSFFITACLPVLDNNAVSF